MYMNPEVLSGYGIDLDQNSDILNNSGVYGSIFQRNCHDHDDHATDASEWFATGELYQGLSHLFPLPPKPLRLNHD